ncbi:hypothetical protein [Brevibacillus dissolubilis]|uniref:PD-(D/E)XK nuclease domain-containing protein n=1 Tax=Brevibacillus dissolubilis TaxID=1844116 RepID=UPI001116243E|nr:hypothetical protein [Brevibacillus dissolubilis]
MSVTEIRGDKDTVIGLINEQIKVLKVDIIENKLFDNKDLAELEGEFKRWRLTTSRILERCFNDNSVAQQFVMLSEDSRIQLKRYNIFDENVKIETEIMIHVTDTMNFLWGLTKDIRKGLYDPLDISEGEASTDYITRETAVEIIKRILKNFYKHIEVMYHAPIHGRGTLKQKDLNQIQIGNEYDVQRILYGLIKPIFPLARVEVADDAKYKSVRFDISIDEYNIIIEVKCTRDNMSERKLTEELGSDCFHYPAGSHLFLFIYDKAKIITNPDAFQTAFRREMKKDHSDKDIEPIILQPISL